MATELPDIYQNSNYNQISFKTTDSNLIGRKTDSSKHAYNRNFNKYYKTNNINDIISPQSQFYPKSEDDEVKVEPKQEIIGNLLSLRKSYDLLRNKSTQKEKEIVDMKNEIEQLKIQELTVEDLSGDNTYKKSYLINQHDSIQEKLQEASMNKKTYEHMIERMKKDLITYKLKIYSAQNSLSFGNRIQSQVKDRYLNVKQKQAKTNKALDEVASQIDNENYQREQNISKFTQSQLNKSEIEKSRDERQKRQAEIAELAANDVRDSNIKKWRKLLQVHQFLNIFLKSKMEREMNKYRGVEKAFQEIKASTGINEANEIVHKFLNREQTYSQLLNTIADYEKRIEDLKKQNDELKNRLNKLKSEVQPIEKVDIQKINYQLEGVIENYKNAREKEEFSKLTQERVYNWLLKQLVKLDRAIGKDQDITKYNELYKKNDLYKIFSEIIAILKEQFLTLDPSEVDKIVTEYIKENNLSNGLIQPFSSANEKQQEAFDEFYKRNVRVRPVSKANKAILNDSGNNNQSKDNSQQSEEIVQNDISEKLDDSKEEIIHIKEKRDAVKLESPLNIVKKQVQLKK